MGDGALKRRLRHGVIVEGERYLDHERIRVGRRVVCRHVWRLWTAEDVDREANYLGPTKNSLAENPSKNTSQIPEEFL